MKEIQLTKGYVALVDDEDYEGLVTHRWKANVAAENHIYAVRANFKMHRVVMNAPVGLVVDHINGNTLDNRKCNLRICEQYKNAINRGTHSKKKLSRFKGVCLDRRTGRWIAGIRMDGNKKCLGYFDREIDAAAAYNIAAIAHHGEFARINDASLLEGAVPVKRVWRHDGEHNARAKLTYDAVQAIRASGERTDALAIRYGVNKSTIIRARSGANWKPVEAAGLRKGRP